jgi:hypothetical protein
MDTNQNPLDSNMKLGNLRVILSEIANEIGDNLEVWLSSDEEGNEFLPMPANEEMSIGIDRDTMRIVFFPSHR